MRKTILYIILFVIPLVNNTTGANFDSGTADNMDIYGILNLANNGLSKEVFNFAVKGLKKLVTFGKLQNPDIVTIADYSQSSNKKRLYVIDLKNKKLLFNTYVAHGRNSGDEYAKSFSNKVGSLMSSLGFYVTEQPIIGLHIGLSLMIDGVEKGINDNAVKREIIIHAAEYVTENFIKKFGRLGRSLGCPALPPDLNEPIIETIKGGTCLFIYNPNNTYIGRSSLLN